VTLLVLPRPLTDGFVPTAADYEILSRVEIEVVADEHAAALERGDVLVTGFATQTLDPLELARRMPRLRWIHSLFAGVDSLVARELVERGIVVTNASGVYAPAMAEYAFAALVLLARGLPELLAASAEHRWSDHRLARELSGKRVGIVGFGGVGRRVARLCVAAEMDVRAIRRAPAADGGEPGVRLGGPDDLEDMLGWCDALVLSASANASTRGLIGARELALLPAHALLVNVARGELLDESALAAALNAGGIAGAMLDVTMSEPLPPESPLWSARNLWITPHMSGGTLESRARSLDLLVDNVRRYISGETLVNVVDLELELRGA
jgi:phosphoglycerate dehydrogenase-like enzyme